MEETITNAEVADVLTGIADLLESSGENIYKVRAYRNAVATLEGLQEPVAEIVKQGKLHELHGFGDSMVARTEEILRTGTAQLYEQLKGERQTRIVRPGELDTEAPKDEQAEDEIPSPW